MPDYAVSEMAARIAREKPAAALSFVHVSGALGLGVLDALRGHAVGSFHPLQSFPEPRDPSAFRGITVAIDASTPALRRRLAKLARDLGAKPRRVDDSGRALYHAAAVFASNYVVASIDEAVQVLEAAGWRRAEAAKALIPLVEGVVANVRRRGTVRALTGPIRRGDAETVGRHIAALNRIGPSGAARHLPTSGEALPSIEVVYRMLGLVALEIAKEAGLDPAAAGRTKRALTRDVAATRRRGRR